jgi:hypothetical protein
MRYCSWMLQQHDTGPSHTQPLWLALSLFSEVARQLRAFITPCLASFLSLSFSRCVFSLPPVNFVIILTHNKTESSHFFARNTRKRFLCGKSTAWPRSVVQFSVCRNGLVTFRMSVCLSVCLSACLSVSLTTRWRIAKRFGILFHYTSASIRNLHWYRMTTLDTYSYMRLSEWTRQATYVCAERNIAARSRNHCCRGKKKGLHILSVCL